jgi:flagellar M-ring protein FliF
VGGIRNLLGNMTPRGRIVLGLSAAGILATAFLLFRIASAPQYATLATGIDPAETGKITAALDERGVPYELQNNGTALAVEKSRTAEARIALAEQGLGQGSKEKGWELFDTQKLGASDLQQRVNYQRALEGEISRALMQVDGVSAAEVQLVLPEEQLFTEDQAPATAAVMLSGDVDALDQSAVRGMAQLTASSVKGLKPNNVSITGSNGELLWPKGDGDGGGMNPGAKQLAEFRYERQLEGSLNGLIMQTLGPNKARVEVKADLNADRATRDELEYGRRGVALKERAEQERLRGGGQGGGASGTAGNLPPYAGGAQAGANSNYNRKSNEVENGVPKTVTRTQVAPGQVNRQSVALVVDEAVSPGEREQLEQAVAGAAGIDEQRGDTIAVSTIAFAKPPPPEEPGAVSGILGYARYAALGLAVLAFLIFIARHLRRREDEGLAREPQWLREIETPMSLAELEQTQQLPDPETALVPGAGEVAQSQARRQVEELVQREPERVAGQVRAWLNED